MGHPKRFSEFRARPPARPASHLRETGGGQLGTGSDFRGVKLAIEDPSSGLSFETGDGQTLSKWLFFERNGHAFFDSRAFRRARGRGDGIDRALEVLEDHIAGRAT